MGKHLVDGAHAVGALGVAEPGVVLDEAGMGEEERGHVIDAILVFERRYPPAGAGTT
jgi:hypothetical protein